MTIRIQCGLCLVIAATSLVRLANADDSQTERVASWEPVIVLTANAQVFKGDLPGPRISPGTIVYVSHSKQNWLLVPRYNSWLHEQHVRSLPDALDFLDQQIEQQPTGDLFHYRAIVLSELGRAKDAVRDFDSAIALGADSSNVFLNRGLAWARAGNSELAFADFDISIQRDESNSHAYFNRGVLLSRDDQHAAAVESFNRAIEFESSYAEAYNNRGVAHESIGHINQALADYNRAIELRPRYPAALTNRGYVHHLEGDYSAAIADYGAALKMAPDAHPTLNDLAWLLATCPDDNVRNAQAALQYAERASRLMDDEDADYLDTLAAAAAAAGDFDRAVQAVKDAIELAPEETRSELQARLALYLDQQPYLDQGEPGRRNRKRTRDNAETNPVDRTTAAPE